MLTWPGKTALVDALELRRWALALLCDDQLPVQLPPALAECSATAWTLFLRIEACALPLTDRLTAGGAPRLAADAAHALTTAVARERRHVVSAWWQLHLLGRIARERALPLIVLKTGAAVAAGRALDLLDLDVLPAPGRAYELADALHAHGYHAEGDDVVGLHHLAGRVAPGSIRIEIHTLVPGCPPVAELFARARTVSRIEPLLCLGAADHLWHLLYHSTVHHMQRRGRLRELLLLRSAAAACSPADLAAVRDQIAASVRPARLRTTLAAALAAGDPPAGPWRGASAAVAARYVLLTRFDRLSTRPQGQAIINQALALVAAERSWWTEMRAHSTDVHDIPSALPTLARAERRFPRAGRLVRHMLIAARTPAVASLAAFAAASGWRAERTRSGPGTKTVRT